jgi:hypothetical protein
VLWVRYSMQSFFHKFLPLNDVIKVCLLVTI